MKFPLKITNIKIIFILLLLIFFFIVVYTLKFSFLSSFSIAAKAIQFNFGYLFLIPGFTALFSTFRSVNLKHVLSATFWVITLELLVEFALIRVLNVSPGSFTHYPKVAHIQLDRVTGEYIAERLLGMAGNASVTGVLYTTSFALYIGCLLKENGKVFNKKILAIIFTFVGCFFMIVSGSAFFAIIGSLFLVWIQKNGNLIKNSIIAVLVLAGVLASFNYVSGLTDAFGNKFTTEYLFLLLQNDDVQGSLPYLINEMSIGYNWFKFFFGSYYFEWGNPDAVIRTVDYFYVNLVYEFGLIGLFLFAYIIKITFNAVKKVQLLDDNYLKFGFFVIILGSLHYPAIAYMASQVFLSSIAAIALRDFNFERERIVLNDSFKVT